MCPVDFTCQKKGLVESAGTEALGMEGHGDEKIDFFPGKGIVNITSHKSSERAGELTVISELEGENGLSETVVVETDGPAGVEGKRAVQTTAAWM